ncbi:hypothetical protein [Dokdonella ginsengisoli]|uniref:Uncharacterized protein n=1 Tax=Dokdonella ginsengisoli TaxID=363846 RepID=A0ABV9QVW0_9GAMM
MQDSLNQTGWQKTFPSAEDGWRAAYRFRPYLANAPEYELQDRLTYILRNLLTITPEGKISLSKDEHGRKYWLQKLTHLNLELWRRNKPPINPTNFPDMIPFGEKELVLSKTNSEFIKYTKIRPVFARYDDAPYAQRLKQQGELRIKPASAFSDVTLDHARHDNELSLEVITAPCDYDLGLVGSDTRLRFPERQWLRYSCKKPSDFYIYCLTTSFDFRYFEDFSMRPPVTPACVLIRDQKKFEHLIIAAAQRELPDWKIKFGPARYIEPYSLGERISWAGEDIYFFKHHRYMYQREYRLICIPPSPVFDTLQPKILTLGSLEDITELLTPKVSPTA